MFVLLSGAALEHGGVVSTHPFFTAAYPASTALMWGAAFGTLAGAAASLSLCAALALARPVNGIELSTLNSNQLQAFLSGARALSKAQWQPVYTAAAVGAYVRAGFTVSAT